MLHGLFRGFSARSEIAILQDGIKEVGLPDRPKGIPDEIYSNLLKLLSRHLLEVGNHLKLFPHPGEGDASSPRYFPVGEEEFFIEHERDVKDSTAGKTLEELLLLLFPMKIQLGG